jgi:phenylacetate-coenzyme A ligase PaaK-like adenylate-forming protein
MSDFDKEIVISEEIDFIKNELDKFDENIRILWEETLMPYINSHNKEILTNMSEFDNYKFYKFMYENSPVYKKLMKKLKILENLKNIKK